MSSPGATRSEACSLRIYVNEWGAGAYPPDDGTPGGIQGWRLDRTSGLPTDALALEGGNNLPERQFLYNTLVSQFNIPEDQHDEFVDRFTKNCKFLGISQTFDVKQVLPGTTRRHDRDAAPRSSEAIADNGGSDAVTVDAPGGEDTPVCFAIPRWRSCLLPSPSVVR